MLSPCQFPAVTTWHVSQVLRVVFGCIHFCDPGCRDLRRDAVGKGAGALRASDAVHRRHAAAGKQAGFAKRLQQCAAPRIECRA
jgi:hypothetical protein